MRARTLLAIAVVLVAILPSRPGSAFQLVETLWYAGDFDGSGGYVDFVGDQSTNKVFENFVVPDATGWHVRQIWSSGFNVSANSVEQAEWSIRTGMAPGSAGSIVAEDISPATQSPTGRAYVAPSLNEPEYAVRVSGLDLVLPPGEYWLNVTPLTGSAQFALSVTTGAGGVGAPIGDAGTALWWWSNGNHVYDEVAPGFSMGVAGSVVPESEAGALPAALLALGLLRWMRGPSPPMVA